MNILATDSKGMVGCALCANLKNIRDGKNRTRQYISIEEIYECDTENSIEELNGFCGKADFILAGIDEKSLLQAVEMNKNGDLGIPVPDYKDKNVSDKVIKII